MTTIPNNVRKSTVLAISFTMLLGVSSLAQQPARIIEYKFPWGVDRVTFDPSRVQVEDLNHWMELSPTLGNYNFMIVPEGIELLCKPNDPRYLCPARFDPESEEWNPNLANAQLNLSSIANRIKKLSPEHYPPELAGVVTYLRKLQSMHLWMEQQELAFLETNDIGTLEKRYNGINPQKECENVVGHIHSISDLKLRSHLARFDWHNCVLTAIQKELGPYPLEQWKAFLRAYGIEETRVDEDIDD
jgi:hypothetical protein